MKKLKAVFWFEQGNPIKQKIKVKIKNEILHFVQYLIC